MNSVLFVRSGNNLLFFEKKSVNLSKSAFRRYKVIDSVLRNSMNRYPKMVDFMEACHSKLDFYPSEETIQKDIANMRLPYPDGFDAPIRYNRAERGYEYTDSEYSLFFTRIQRSVNSIYQ